MGISFLSTVNIWLLVGPLLVFTTFLLALLLKRQQEERTMTVMVAELMRKRASTKEETRTIERLGPHHQNMLMNEALFLFALILLAVGFLREDWVVFGIGFGVMMLTLFLLQLMLSHPSGKPSHHLFKMFEGGGSAEKEMLVVRYAQDLLHKEKMLKMRERELARQMEAIYKLATVLDEKDVSLRQKEGVKTKSGKKPKQEADPDTRLVLMKLDGLLEKLPDEDVTAFMNSPDYAVYQRVMEQVK